MVAPIREYQQQTNTPTYDFSGRSATAEDFGYGAAIGEIGATIQRTGDMWKRQQEQDELADAQIRVAESQNMFADRMSTLQKNAKPGEYTAGAIRNEMNEYYNTLANTYKSDSARKYMQMNGARLTGHAFQQAVAFDVDLKVKDQFVKQDKWIDMAHQNVLVNPASYSAYVSTMEAEAKAGIGMWANPGDAKTGMALQKRVEQMKEVLAKAAAEGALRNPSERGRFDGYIQVAKEKFGLTTKLPEAVLAYKSTADKYGDQFGVDSSILLAQINAESGGRTDAVSPTGVKGLSQFTKATAARYGVDRNDPDSNIKGQANYMSDLLKMFGGDYAKALAGYNAGEGNVQKAVAKYGDKWLENIAEFTGDAKAKEVTGYVNRILKTVTKEGDPVEKAVEIKDAPQWYKDMKPSDRISFLRTVDVRSRQERAVADKMQDQIIKDVETYFVQNGKLPTDIPNSQQFADPMKKAQYESMLGTFGQIQSVVNAPLQDQRTVLEKLKPTMTEEQNPGVYRQQALMYNKALDVMNKANKERAQDPIGAAIMRGFSMDSPIVALDPQKGDFEPEKFAASMKVRLAQADAVNNAYGTKGFVLAKAEAENLRRFVDNSSYQDATNWLLKTARNMDAEGFRNVMAQVAPGDNALRFTSVLANQNVPEQKRIQDVNYVMVGRNLIQGALPVSKEKGEKGERKVQNDMLPSDVEVGRMFEQLTGNFVATPEEKSKMIEMVRAHYVGALQAQNVFNKGLGEKDPPSNKNVLKQSVEAIVGIPTKIGATRVVRPYGMDDATFQNSVYEQARIYGFEKDSFSLHPSTGGRYQILKGADQPTGIYIDVSKPFYRAGEVEMPIMQQQTATGSPFAMPYVKGEKGGMVQAEDAYAKQAKGVVGDIGGALESVSNVLGNVPSPLSPLSSLLQKKGKK